MSWLMYFIITFIGCLICSVITKNRTELKYMEMMRDDNRLAQRLIDESYQNGIREGRRRALAEMEVLNDQD